MASKSSSSPANCRRAESLRDEPSLLGVQRGLIDDSADFGQGHAHIGHAGAHFAGQRQLANAPGKRFHQRAIGVGRVEAAAGEDGDHRQQQTQANKQFYAERPLYQHGYRAIPFVRLGLAQQHARLRAFPPKAVLNPTFMLGDGADPTGAGAASPFRPPEAGGTGEGIRWVPQSPVLKHGPNTAFGGKDHEWPSRFSRLHIELIAGAMFEGPRALGTAGV